MSYLASSKTTTGYPIACFSKPLALLVEKISFWYDGEDKSNRNRLPAGELLSISLKKNFILEPEGSFWYSERRFLFYCHFLGLIKL
jgi:hypothetical protein